MAQLQIKESAHFNFSSNGQHYDYDPNCYQTDQEEDDEAVRAASVYFYELGGTNGRCSEFNCDDITSSEGTEFDVEKVLAKQSTHDLRCPDCNSCITGRIILHRRKPEFRNPRQHDKAETPFHYQHDPDSMSAVPTAGHDLAFTVGVDILKSIVYGGLIESITSLGVICSAAGAGAATLDIFAMALANLIGGLFIIGHNLIGLKNEASRWTSSQINPQDDRYQALLGKRNRSSLHVTVVIISYLIFGLLPPIIYGFSFRKSDDKDLKLALVGGASLVCIILLAIGKAHVLQKPYICNVLCYVILGFMASGASYIVGDLIGKLMQQVGWFHSSLSLVTPYSETQSNEPLLTSY